MNKRHEFELNSHIANLKTEQPSEQLVEEVQSRLMSRIAERAEEQRSIKTQGEKSGWFEWMKRFNLRPMAMAASIATFAMVLTSLLLPTQSNTTFAAVVSTLSRLETMHYRASMEVGGNTVTDMAIYFKQPGHLRIVMLPNAEDSENGEAITITNIMDVRAGKGLTLIEPVKVAVPFEFSGMDYADPASDPLDWYNRLLDYKDGPVEDLDMKQLNGEWVQGFRIVQENVVVTLWANPLTNLPVEVNVSIEDIDFRYHIEMEFDTAIDDTLFSTEVPEGYALDDTSDVNF